MTTDRAKQIIGDAADAHDLEDDELWERIVKDLDYPHPSGYEAAHKKIRALCDLCIDDAGADADVDEMAQVLRGEIKRRADEHDLVSTTSRLSPSDVIEASYIWCRGETGDVTMDTELTFGQYEGKTIRWLFENDRDYANWVISEMVENRPHLATFLAIEEDKRREAEETAGRTYFRRGDECIA